MDRITLVGYSGLVLFAISLAAFAALTTYEMVQRPYDKIPPVLGINEPVRSADLFSNSPQAAPKKSTCFPGCEKAKILPGKNDTNPVETWRWRCSRKSMYEGGKDGGLCDNVTECREPNPTCCCYDFQCDKCEE